MARVIVFDSEGVDYLAWLASVLSFSSQVPTAFGFELHTSLGKLVVRGTGLETGAGTVTAVDFVGLDGNLKARVTDLGIAQAELSVAVVTARNTGDGMPVRTLLEALRTTFQGNQGADLFSGGNLDDVIQGLGGDDLLFGGSGSDALYGMDGDDILSGGSAAGGVNQLWGGAGTDTASYEGTAATVCVDLRGQWGRVGGLLTDLMNSIENARGGGGDDVLVGTASSNTLAGASGHDALYGLDGDDLLQGGAGNDQLWGGAGSDWADYSDQTLAVAINLATQTGSGAGAGRDTFNAVENARGGAGIDLIRGSEGANLIEGGGARDILYGFSGADSFVYAAATDSRLSTGYDTIADFQPGADKLDLTALGIMAAMVTIASGPSSTALYADVDGVSGIGPDDLAIAFQGANAITSADLLF